MSIYEYCVWRQLKKWKHKVCILSMAIFVAAHECDFQNRSLIEWFRKCILPTSPSRLLLPIHCVITNAAYLYQWHMRIAIHFFRKRTEFLGNFLHQLSISLSQWLFVTHVEEWNLFSLLKRVNNTFPRIQIKKITDVDISNFLLTNYVHKNHKAQLFFHSLITRTFFQLAHIYSTKRGQQ